MATTTRVLQLYYARNEVVFGPALDGIDWLVVAVVLVLVLVLVLLLAWALSPVWEVVLCQFSVAPNYDNADNDDDDDDDDIQIGKVGSKIDTGL
ncbi:GL15916 [Drosophila persimilis]|uniref:GL15916 n=1 Tax=Drosophila persimilis TaxID=7234 RepID=B4H146_DROPE|nr:GL15916 [Drosophila persimilis]